MMDRLTPYRALSSTILGSSPAIAELFASRFTDWYGKVLNELYVLVGDSPVHLVDVRLEDGAFMADPHTARVVLFTESQRITVTASRDEKGVESHTTTARSRRGLRTLAVTSPVTVFSPGFNQLPGEVVVTLTYDDETLVLPTEGSTPEQHEAIVAAIPTFLSDLEK